MKPFIIGVSQDDQLVIASKLYFKHFKSDRHRDPDFQSFQQLYAETRRGLPTSGADLRLQEVRREKLIIG